jgi:hypothetical protein
LIGKRGPGCDEIPRIEGAPPKRRLFLIAARESEEDRQGDFASAKIVADALAELGLPCGKIEHVVDQLERDPEIARRRVADWRARLAEQRARPALRRGGIIPGRSCGFCRYWRLIGRNVPSIHEDK